MSKKQTIEQIESLFSEADKVFDKDKEKANLFVKKARTLAMSINLELPRELKRRFCPKCYSFLVPNKNCKVRLSSSKLIYHCGECKNMWKLPLK